MYIQVLPFITPIFTQNNLKIMNIIESFKRLNHIVNEDYRLSDRHTDIN